MGWIEENSNGNFRNMKQSLFVTGGLGNQMFQYAMILAMKHRGKSVTKNTSLYDYNPMHNGYMLDTAFGISDGKCCALFSNLLIIWNRLIRSNRLPFLLYKEDETRFCDGAFNTKKLYLDGCWINERYFEEIKDKILSTFVFKGIDNRNVILSDEMKQCNSVSLHIRRGDYLKNPMYNVCDEDYYVSAITYIKENVEAPKFYVFSDDPRWCKEFMKKMNVDYSIIEHNSGKDCFKDMFLMTQCRHNIIANSTFSWWGAWLNLHDEKIVVCPSIWIRGRDFNPCLENWYHIK